MASTAARAPPTSGERGSTDARAAAPLRFTAAMASAAEGGGGGAAEVRHLRFWREW